VALGHLGRDFGLKSKPVFPEIELPEQFSAEGLVARPNVCQMQIGKEIGKHSEEFIAQIMPIAAPVVLAFQKPGPVHHICGAPLDGFQEFVIILGIELEIRVLDDDNSPACFPETPAKGRPFPGILLLEKDPDRGGSVSPACSWPALRESSWRNSRVPSVEPSSTMMISFSMATSRTLPRISSMVLRSL